MIPPPLDDCAALSRFYFVYLLRSVVDGRSYVGWTTDIERRLREHNAGKSSYTRNRGPYELIYYEAYSRREEALGRENSLKNHPNVLKQLKNRLFMTLPRASSNHQEVVG